MAGWKFQRRNPSRAPARAKHRTAISGCPVVTWEQSVVVPACTSSFVLFVYTFQAVFALCISLPIMRISGSTAPPSHSDAVRLTHGQIPG